MARQPASEEQREQVRDWIRAAATEVYRAGGIGNVSARAIAAQAGVSVGTLYSYFGNLQELMQSLWREPVARFEKRLEAIARDHAVPLDRVEALLQAYLSFALKRPELYRGTFMFVRPEAEEKPSREKFTSSAFGRLLSEAIVEGQREGSIRSGDPLGLAQFLWSGLHGAIALPINIDRLRFKSVRPAAREMIERLLVDLARPS